MAKLLTSQPFPFRHFDIESGDFLPCGTTSGRYVQGTPTEMMELFWKTRVFSISGSYTNYLFNQGEPLQESFEATVSSLAGSETELVCVPGYTISTSVAGPRINELNVSFDFVGADFYFNSPINQPVVKLYGNFIITTDADDAGYINTQVGGSLDPFLINGFQVYEDGNPVNYNAVSLIDNFTASIVPSVLWGFS
jgi:hypothetical protein